MWIPRTQPLMSLLPTDTANAANVWCEACNQSLPAGRAKAHVASKKHTNNLGAPPVEVGPSAAPKSKQGRAAAEENAPAAPAEVKKSRTGPTGVKPRRTGAKKAAGARAPSGGASTSSEDDGEREGEDSPAEKARRPAAPVRKVGGLATDPNREGHYWCGICEVSLASGPAENHLTTKRHQDNAAKFLEAGMRNMKLSSRA